MELNQIYNLQDSNNVNINDSNNTNGNQSTFYPQIQ